MKLPCAAVSGNRTSNTSLQLLILFAIGTLLVIGCSEAPVQAPSGLDDSPGVPAPAGHAIELDLTDPGLFATHGGAYFAQSDLPGTNEGTGNLAPFLAIKNPTLTSDGANTVADLTRDEDGSKTNEVRLDAVPALPCPSGSGFSGVCREFRLDINEPNNDPSWYLSVDRIRVFLHTDPNVDGDDFNESMANGGIGADLIYDLDAAGDAFVGLDFRDEPGSGVGDMFMLIPDDDFSSVVGDDSCDFDGGQGTDCGHWVLFYSQVGAAGDPLFTNPGQIHDGYAADKGGFEEWGLRLLPFVDVQKTVTTIVTRQQMWDIAKTVDVDQWDIFEGDSATSKYTIAVDLLDGQTTDVDWDVEGTFTITNPSSEDAEILSIVDSLSDGTLQDWSCPGGITDDNFQSGDIVLNKNGGSITCDWGPYDFDSDPTGLDNVVNVVVAQAAGAETPLEGTVDDDVEAIDFSTPDSIVTEDGTVYVDDTNDDGDLSGIMADTTYMYTDSWVCDGDEGTHANTATLYNQDDEFLADSSASVTVSCYDLTVTKDADTELDRDWDWTISKTGAQDTLHLAAGQAFVNYTYTVTVDTSGHTDSNWKVSGSIKIKNANPSAAAPLSSVIDSIAPDDIAASVSCPASSVAAADSITCTYGPVSLSDASARTNTAYADLQNRHFSGSDTTDQSGNTTQYKGSAGFDFTNPDTVNEIDECIDVVDDFATTDTADDVDLGTTCITDTLPADLTYQKDFGPFTTAECGEISVVNTSSFATTDDANDTNETGSDPFTLTIVVECPDSCSLTQGYWKTHNDSFHGGAPPDDTWSDLPTSESTLFYISGHTWFEVFWTPPKGNVYYNLAHQYMAAVLNGLNDADTSIISSELATADQFFQECTPAQVDGAKGNQPLTCSVTDDLGRKDLIDLAGTLADFNEGNLPGVTHCDEDETSSS